MIKVDRGHIHIEGIELMIRAEFSLIVRTLNQQGLLTKEEIEEDVETGLMEDVDLNKRTKKSIEILLDKIKKEMED